MLSRIWDHAQKKPWCWTSGLDGKWPRRCTQCGRRLRFDNYVSIYVGVFEKTSVIINTVCFQHGGVHSDCLKGIEVDYGEGRSWMLIWLSNTLDELSFWCRTILRFAASLISYLLHMAMHPIKCYRYYKQIKRVHDTQSSE